MNNRSNKRICLWSGPRNISTALMYSFAQRSDTMVVDEPLYAHYLSHTDASEYHPGSEEILANMENDGQKVIDWMLGFHEKEVLFLKQMTHHLVDLDWSFLNQTINIILTRDPREMLPSYAKAVENPTMKDVGYAKHLELLSYLEKIGQKPIVLISRKVLEDPKTMLMKLCDSVGIPFEESMLHWKEGPLPEDGVWAKYWYDSVHKSTGFKPYQPKNKPFPERLIPLLNECKPIYNELLNYAL